MSQNLSSAAVVIGALRVNSLLIPFANSLESDQAKHSDGISERIFEEKFILEKKINRR